MVDLSAIAVISAPHLSTRQKMSSQLARQDAAWFVNKAGLNLFIFYSFI
jgi:hypothetical protein